VGRSRYDTTAAVLLIWASLLAFVFSGRMYTTDVLAQYEVAGSLAGQRQLLAVSGDYGWTVEGVRQGPFVPHGIGFSVLAVPAAILGGAAGLQAGKVALSLINSGMSLALIGFWYAAAGRRFGRVPVPRFLLVAVGSMALVYGKLTFDVTTAAAAAMGAYYFSRSGKHTLAGALFGLSILVRTDSVLLFPVFIARPREMARMAAGAAPFLFIMLAANWYRFGSPFLDGHGQDPAIALQPFRGGIPGLLLSPGKGLLYYAPLCVFALFHQRDWRLWSPFILSLVFHGMLHDWTGGTGWGPRFLFTSLPFLLMPLCRPGAGGRAFWLAGALGAAAAMPALWTNPSLVEQTAGADLFSEPSRQAVIWNYSSSPLFLSFREIAAGPPDIFGATAASEAGISPWAGVLGQWLAAALLAVAGVMKLRRAGTEEGAAA